MEKFKKICLPCDLPQWTEIKKLLNIAKSASTAEAWIHQLQKVYDVVHLFSLNENIDYKGEKSKSPNIFQGLLIYLSFYLSSDSSQRYLKELLPFIVDVAMQIETFGAECDFVVPDGDTTIVLTRACSCSLLACSLLCILPLDQARSQPLTSKYHPRTFEGLFEDISRNESTSDFQLQKLHCIFQYYELVSKKLVNANEEIIFVRQILKNIPVLETWLNSARPLCHVDVVCSGVERARHTKNGCLILFGEESYGSRMFGSGIDEMEICFTENPELMSAMLFFDRHVENEVIVVRGATRYTTFPPRPLISGVQLSGSVQMMERMQSASWPTICCSTLPKNGTTDIKSFMYRHKTVVRIATKMLSAFQQLSLDRSGFEEEEEEKERLDDEERGASFKKVELDADFPSDIQTLSKHHQHLRSIRLANSNSTELSSSESQTVSRSLAGKRTQPWRSQSSSASSGSIDWARRTMSFELESSNQVSSGSSGSPVGGMARIGGGAMGGEEIASGSGRRRSSGLHSISRRSSGLSYQLSEEGGAYSRRRSSAMSEASQRSGFNSSSSSSSGKRSSTDYSSEMEEYFESFQKRSSIKTSVIEEESFGMTEETGKLSSEIKKSFRPLLQQQSLHRFVRNQPVDAVRPTPVKYSSLDMPMMALDNFTDNLINQVAQDSREEIARMATKEQRRIQIPNLRHTSDMKIGLPLSSKFFRRGKSADLFNFKMKEAYSTCHSTERSKELDQLVDTFSDSSSKRILMSIFPEIAHIRGGLSSIPYETTETLEEFAGDFVEGVLGEAFQVIGNKGVVGSYQILKPDAKIRKGFFVDENQLNIYRKKESDKRHICTGSICFDEEDMDEDDYDDDYQEGISSTTICSNFEAGPPPRPRTIGRSLSSGFRDPILSDFEDLLVNSCINSPGRIMFTSGEGSIFGQPIDHAYLSALWTKSTIDQRDIDRSKRSRDVATMCSRWFRPSGVAYSTWSFDGYAERFVVEIFRGAICQLLDNQVTAMTSQICYKSLATVEDYALNLVQCILEEAIIDLERRVLAPPCGVVIGVVAGADKGKELVEGTSTQREWSIGIQDLNNQVLVGHYRVGIYRDDPEIQALLYWLCASYMGLPSLIYYSHGNSMTNKLSTLVEVVMSRDWTVGTLFSELLLWCSTGVDQSRGDIMEGLIDFLLLRRLR